MARCCSQTTSCNCVLTPGTGVSISGSGTTDDPYIITAPDVVTLRGSVDPEGAVVGNPGDIYTSTDVAATLGQSTWEKATGTGDTGWVLIAGDTGWRDISATAVNGFVGTIAIRRTATTVEARLIGLDGTASTAADIAPIPSGFAFGAGTVTVLPALGLLHSDTSVEPDIFLAADNSTISTSATLVVGADDWLGSVIGHANDTWPIALPGTALA